MVNPKNGDEYPVNPLRSWAITKDTFQQYYDEGRVIFPGDYEFLDISKPVLRYWKEDDIKKAGDEYGLTAASSYLPPEVGMTQDGTKELTDIFGSKVFSFPKPSSLIQYLLKIAVGTKKDCIILDSFAGSGTTAHAVLNLNRQDGGHRKFILCEMCDYAETITAERVRRVIDGYGEGKNAVEGTGGSFDFYELGDTLFDPKSGMLNNDANTEQIREYVWYTETHATYTKPSANANPYLLGHHEHNDYYFYYEKDEDTTLDKDFLRTITEKADRYIIYADRCLLTKDELERYNIVFKKIPRDIKRF